MTLFTRIWPQRSTIAICKRFSKIAPDGAASGSITSIVISGFSRKGRRYAVGFALLSTLYPTIALAQDKAEIKSAIEGIVKHQAARLRVPGVAFGLVVDGEVVSKFAQGTRQVSGKEPVTTETTFQLGSISKPFVAMLATRFQSQYKLHFSDPIKTYLPRRCRDGACEGITIKHLLSHTSGIPSHGTIELIEKNMPFEAVVSQTLKLKRPCAPGDCFQYNNVTYQLVAEILEKAGGRPYLDLLKTEILTPLNMTSTSASFADLKRGGNFFTPHLFRNEKFVETSYSASWYSFPAAGGINSNVDDMLKLVVAELGGAPAVLSPEMLKVMHAPVREAFDVYAWFEQPVQGKRLRSRYAIGHRMLASNELTVVFHTAWVKGVKNIMVLIPEKKVGFVLLQNSASDLCIRVLEDVIRYFHKKP